MAIKPPKQFCGEDHWSGQPCKKCDAIKARKFAPAKVDEPAPVPVGPCPMCETQKKTISTLSDELAAALEKLREYEGQAERLRQATLARVKKYREKQAKP